MVVVGGALSLVAAAIVLAVIDRTGCLDTMTLHDHPSEYIFNEPVRVFSAALAFYGLAYGAAYLMARIAYRGSTAAIEPGVTGWGHAMWVNLPDKKRPVMVTVELKDGRKIAGGLGSFTVGSEENREIVLVRPLIATSGSREAAASLEEDFVVLREDQIRVVSGVY
jgi:hypothetical protein